MLTLARSTRSERVGVGAASVLALAIALSGCSVSVGGNTVNTDKAEEEIAKGIKDQTGMDVTVDCPDDISAEAGGQFACTVETSDGKSGTVMVTQNDDEGNINWELENSGDFTSGAASLNMAKVQESITTWIAEQLKVTATVECPTTVPMEKGNTFECTATDGEGNTTTVKVTQTDDQGNVTWETV